MYRDHSDTWILMWIRAIHGSTRIGAGTDYGWILLPGYILGRRVAEKLQDWLDSCVGPYTSPGREICRTGKNEKNIREHGWMRLNDWLIIIFILENCFKMLWNAVSRDTPGIGPGSEEQSPGESHLESAAAACAPVLAGTLPKAGAMSGHGVKLVTCNCSYQLE